jgi:hypothetical protein
MPPKIFCGDPTGRFCAEADTRSPLPAPQHPRQIVNRESRLTEPASTWRADKHGALWIVLISSRLGLDEAGLQADVVAVAGIARHWVVRFRTLRDHLELAGLAARNLVSLPDAPCAGN